VAKHAARHWKRKNRTRRPGKACAVSMAGLLAGGLVLAPDARAVAATPSAHENVLLPATIIFIDGNNYPPISTRMAGQLSGQYQYQACTAPCTHLGAPVSDTQFEFINEPAVYRGTLGLYNGLGAPSGDKSIAHGQRAIDQQIIAVGNTHITVVGYSEGAVATSREVSALGPSSNVSFVLITDPERPDGGILARLPSGTYIPLLGISGGSATSSTGAPVVMVTQQYDGIADAPAYVGNVAADANAVLGGVYLHGNYYPVNPNGGGTVVTTSPDGNMTDILVEAPPGELPLFMPLAQAGVPQPILVALDPAVRAVIESGYVRTDDPSQQVRFALLPPVSALPDDARAVVVGFVTTAQLLPGALVASVPSAQSPLVVAPLKTISPGTPLSPVTASALNPAVPKAQLLTQGQPASQVQRHTVKNLMSTLGTDVGQQTTRPLTTWSPNASPLGAGSAQTQSTPTPQRPRVNILSGRDLTRSIGADLPQPKAIRPKGDGPLKKALNALTGQKPKPTPEDKPADKPAGDKAA
jgi:PE-PPE domain